MGCLNYTIRSPVGVGERSQRVCLTTCKCFHLCFTCFFKLRCGVSSWSDQPLEPPPVPADLEDCARNRYGKHGGGQTQRDDIRDSLDDVQVDAAGRWDYSTHNAIAIN